MGMKIFRRSSTLTPAAPESIRKAVTQKKDVTLCFQIRSSNWGGSDTEVKTGKCSLLEGIFFLHSSPPHHSSWRIQSLQVVFESLSGAVLQALQDVFANMVVLNQMPETQLAPKKTPKGSFVHETSLKFSIILWLNMKRRGHNSLTYLFCCFFQWSSKETAKGIQVNRFFMTFR